MEASNTQNNEMEIRFDSRSENEGFARVSVASFLTQLNQRVETVRIHCSIENQLFTVEISDRGKGIANVEKAMEPMFTTKPEDDRSGMGFSFMEAFMDTVEVESKVGEGTSVKMTKTIGKGSRIWTTQSL